MGIGNDYKGMTPEQAASMAGVKLDGTPLPTPSTTPEALAHKQIADLKAAKASTTAAPKDFQEAASDFQNKFLDALGVERSWTGIGHKGIWGEADVLKVIEGKSPDALLKAIGEAEPKALGLTKLMRDDSTGLAEDFKNAVVKNPKFLKSLQKLTAAKGDDELNLSDIEEALASDGIKGMAARAMLKKGLKQIAANPELDASLLLEMANKGKKISLGFEDFGQFLDMMKNNPDELIKQMLDGTELANSEMGLALAGFMKGLLPVIATFIDPQGPMLKSFVDLGGNAYGQALDAGREIGLEGKMPETATQKSKVTAKHAGDKYETTEKSGKEVKVTSLDEKDVINDTAFKTASLGIVNPGQEANTMEQDMLRKVNNTNSFSPSSLTA